MDTVYTSMVTFPDPSGGGSQQTSQWPGCRHGGQRLRVKALEHGSLD